uniref:Uncharacterized protein n=1 Tax=Parascaris univalens TaxID=6257 RepID=A0A915AFL1_PARUN
METDQDEQATSAGRESENMTLSTATEQITSEAIAEFNNMPQELHKAAKSAKFSESELQERRSFKDHDGSEIASTDTSLPTDDTVCFDEQQMGHLQNVGNLAEPIRKDSVDKDGHCRDDRLVVLTDVFDAANAALRAMEEEISEKTKELSIQETSIEYKENENLSEKTAGFPDECVSEYDLNNADSLEAVLKTDQIISEEITRRAQEEFEAKNRRTGRTYPMPTQNILDEVVYFQDSTTINPNTTAQQQAPGIEEYHVDRAENGRPNVRSEENSEGAVIKTHKGEADFITASTEEPRMDIVSTEQVSMQNNPQENTGNRSTTVTEMNSMNITQPYEVTNIASGNKNGMNLQDEDASAQAQKTFSSATMAAEECSNLDEEQSQMEQTERQAEITGTELECEHDELLVCQSTSNPRESDDGEGHSITSVAESEQADSAVAEIATKSEADMSFGDEVSSNDAIFEKTTMQTQQSVQTAICEDKSNGKRMLEGEHEEALKRMSDENIETLFDSYFADHGCIKMMVATMREKGVGDEILTNNGEHIIEYGEQSSHLLKKSAELGSTPASELTMHSMSHHFDEVNHSGEVTAEELEYREETCNTDNLPVSSNEMESIANTAAVRSETFPQHETFAEPEFESDLMNCEQVNTEKSSCMSPSADCREDMTLATQNAPYGMPPDFNGTETDDVGVEHIGNDGSKELDRHPKHNEFPLLQPMLDEQQGHQEESVDDDIRRQDNNMRQEEHITRKEEGGQQLTHDQSIFAESTTEQNIIPQEVPVPYVGEAGGRHEYEQPIFPQPTAEQGTLTPQSLLYPEHVDEQLKHEQSTMAQPTAEQGIVPQEQPLAHTEEQLTSPQAMIQEDIIPQDQRLPHVEEEDEQMRHDQVTFPQAAVGQEPPPYPEKGSEELNHEQSTMAQPTAEQGIVPQEQPLAHTEEQLTSPQAMIQEDIIPQDQRLPHVEEEDEQMRHDQATIPKPTTEQDMRPREKPTFCPGEGNEQIKREQPTFAQRTAERDVILQEQPPLYREEEDEHSERGNEQLNHEQPTMAQSTAEQGIIPQEQPLAHTEEQLTSPQAMIQEDIIPQDQPLPHVEEEDEQMRQDQATIPKPTTEQDMRPREKPTFCPGEGNEQIKREQPTFAQRTAERDVILQEQPPLYREEEDEHSERGNEQLNHEQPTMAQSTAEQGIIPQEQPLAHTEEQLTSPQAMIQEDIIPQDQPLPHVEEEDEQMRQDQATIPKPTTEQDMRPQEKPTFCPGEGNEQIKREQPTFAQRTAERDVILQEQPPLYREEEDEHSERGNEQLKHEQPTFAQSMAEQGIIPQEKPLDHTEQQLASPQGTALQGNILPSVQPLPYSDERNEQLTYDQATSSLPAAQQDIMPQPMYCPAGRDEQLEHEQPMLPQLQEDIVPKEQHLPYSEEGEEHLKHDQSIFPQADEDEQHVHQDEGGDNGMKWVDIVPQTLPMRYKGEEEMTALHGVAQKAQYPIEEHTEVEGQNKSDEHESEQRSFRLSYLSSMKPNTNANVLQWESDAFLMDEKKLLSEVERKNEIGEDPSARKQWHYDGSENLEETDEKEAHFEQRASEFGEDRLVTEKPASVVSQVKPIEDENPSSRPQSQLETTGDVSDIKATENHRREEVVEKKRDITPDSLNQSPHVDVRKRTDVVESGKDKNKLREHVPSRREKSDVSGARVPTGAKQLISNKKQNERATMGEALSKTHDQKEMRMSNLVKKQRATAMSNSAVNSSETSSHKVEKPLPRTSLEKIPASKVRQRAADNSKRTPTAYVRTSMKPPVPRKPQRKSGSVENKDAKGSFIAGTGSPEIKAEKVGEKSGGSECKSVKKTPVKVSICEPIVWVETFVPTFEAVWVALLPQDDDIMGAMKNSNECIGPTTRSEVNGIKKAHTATTPETTQKTSGCLQEALRNESISQEEMKFPAVPEESELAIEQIGEGDVLIVSSKETVEVSEEPSSSQHDVISAQESEAIEDSDRTIGRNLTIEAGEKDGKSEGTFPVDKTFFSPKASPHSRAPLESVSRGTSSNSEAPFESSLIAEPHHKDLGSAPIVNDSAELPPQLKDFQSNTSHSAMVDRFVEERSKQILLGNITASNESAGQNTLTEEVNGNIETALSEHYPETLTSTHNRCSEEGISDRRSSGENDGLTTKEEEVAMNAIAIATEAEQLQNEKEKEAINDEKSEEKPSRPRQHGRGQFRGTMMCEQEDWKQSNGRQDSKQKPLQTVEGDGYVNHSQQSSQHKSKKRSRRSGKEKGEICLE